MKNRVSCNQSELPQGNLDPLRACLVCPVCKNELTFASDSIICSSCNTEFPQVDSSWINLFSTTLLSDDEQWSARQQEMENWYQHLISSPAEASFCLLSDYTPFAADIASLSGKVLDIGGGIGLVRHYLPSSVEYTVLDPSLDWLSVEWKSLSDTFPCLATFPSFVRGVGEHLPFPSDCFNAVLSFWSANHSSNPQKLFEEVIRVLRPGGKFLIVLEDMPPLWHDLLNRNFPAEQVHQSFFYSTENHSKYTRLRLMLRLLSGKNFPLQSDHIRIKESEIYEWTKDDLSIVRRVWVNQFLTLDFRKNGVQYAKL
jgi:ubiquinone/menaquinone biosynthesis C-methylase UbiE